MNITSAQLRQPGFHGEINRPLQWHRLANGQLNLEVTEGSLVEDLEGAARDHSASARAERHVFDRRFRNGLFFAELPAQDADPGVENRALVRQSVPDNADDMKLVRSIVSMAHGLELKVVAEGVETERQLLSSVGSDQVQGYVFSPPHTAEAFEAYLTAEPHAGDSPWAKPRTGASLERPGVESP